MAHIQVGTIHQRISTSNDNTRGIIKCPYYTHPFHAGAMIVTHHPNDFIGIMVTGTTVIEDGEIWWWSAFRISRAFKLIVKPVGGFI